MKYRVKHVLADGRELDSLDGYIVKRSSATEGVYRLAERLIREGEKRASDTV